MAKKFNNAMEILLVLPNTNRKECGLSTCLAGAMKALNSGMAIVRNQHIHITKGVTV